VFVVLPFCIEDVLHKLLQALWFHLVAVNHKESIISLKTVEPEGRFWDNQDVVDANPGWLVQGLLVLEFQFRFIGPAADGSFEGTEVILVRCVFGVFLPRSMLFAPTIARYREYGTQTLR
jgi:hypothetical protein